MSVQQAIHVMQSLTDDDLASASQSDLYAMQAEAELIGERAWNAMLDRDNRTIAEQLTVEPKP